MIEVESAPVPWTPPPRLPICTDAAFTRLQNASGGTTEMTQDYIDARLYTVHGQNDAGAMLLDEPQLYHTIHQVLGAVSRGETQFVVWGEEIVDGVRGARRASRSRQESWMVGWDIAHGLWPSEVAEAKMAAFRAQYRLELFNNKWYNDVVCLCTKIQ